MVGDIGKMQVVDLLRVNKDNLPNIDDMEVDISLPVQNKVEELLRKSNNSPFLHECEGYVVSIKTAEEVDTTDAIMHYLKQRLQLRYFSS